MKLKRVKQALFLRRDGVVWEEELLPVRVTDAITYPNEDRMTECFRTSSMWQLLTVSFSFNFKILKEKEKERFFWGGRVVRFRFGSG